MSDKTLKYQKISPPTPDVNDLPKANKDPNVPKLYFNGFVTGMTNADIVILAKLNNESKAVLNLSLSVAKTLVMQLSGLIVGLETSSNNEIMTTDVIDRAMAKLRDDETK
ncbi:MAG: hypothetical protein V5804_12060 [Mucilaginibacter sp.]|uniref:hypothetical protein n=1 Tax=Mucilaginibacter sp. TaxID=1882438 RepID=UPI0034E4763C